MRLGIVSDIHGNGAALEAVLDELKRRRVDEMICLGDAVDPLPGSLEIFRFLTANHVPFLRGNHEDYVVKAAENPLDPVMADAKFKPVQICAASFSAAQILALKHLPLSIIRHDAKAGDLFLCHASPTSNMRGWRNGVGETELGTEIDQVHARTLVAGHWHVPAEHPFHGKTLLTAGSVGIPLSGIPEAEFLILDSAGGSWKPESVHIPYDVDATLREYAKSGWLAQGAPISLLYFYEIATGKRALSTLFIWMGMHGHEVQEPADWPRLVMRYLTETDRLETLNQLLRRVGQPDAEDFLQKIQS